MKVFVVVFLFTFFSVEARVPKKGALTLSKLTVPQTHTLQADNLQSLNQLWIVQLNGLMTVLNEKLKVDLITGQQNQKVMSFSLQSLTF